ncbi:MAG: TetR/AcrR family transcriptional regulator [Anaerolineae bacterium]|nr:TetR/AcrR family transcriptional regulator [Anaerolineae bacterium]
MTKLKRQTRGEQTRTAILDAAMKLFLESGYNGTSMRQIANEAGIALGGIYNHFPGKEDIFKVLVAERIPVDIIREALSEVEDTKGPQMLAEAFERLQAQYRKHYYFFGLLLIDLQEFGGDNARNLIGGVLIPEFMIFANRVRQAGGLREDISNFILLRLFVSLMIGYVLTGVITYSDEQPLIAGLPGDQEARISLIEVFLHGIAEKEGNR